MMGVRPMKDQTPIVASRRVYQVCETLLYVAAFVCVCTWVSGLGLTGSALAQSAGPNEVSGPAAGEPSTAVAAEPGKAGLQERMLGIENELRSIRATGERAEIRSYENKMMSRELIRYVKAVVVVLVLIAVGFPATILILTWKKVLGLSGLSSELAETLLAIEERQAKLATLLREIQVEMDYLNTQPSSDLRNLLQQAEKYVGQNEKDLDIAGFRRASDQTK
jgi:hypothetical protein